jgi:hypothetical protein
MGHETTGNDRIPYHVTSVEQNAQFNQVPARFESMDWLRGTQTERNIKKEIKDE